MATYTVTGHPLNIADLADNATPADLDKIAAALRDKGVGQSVTLTLSGTSDTKVKGHGCLK
jgi:hypothetical protein